MERFLLAVIGRGGWVASEIMQAQEGCEGVQWWMDCGEGCVRGCAVVGFVAMPLLWGLTWVRGVPGGGCG